MQLRIFVYLLNISLTLTAIILPAYAAPSPDSALEHQALIDTFGKAVNGYFYTYHQIRYTNYPSPKVYTRNEKILWLPWGFVKVNAGKLKKVVIFFKGYDSYRLNCTTSGNIDGICVTGSQSDQAQLRAVAYELKNGKAFLVGHSSYLPTISVWTPPTTNKSFIVHNLSNGYTGIFYKINSFGQGISSYIDEIYIIKDRKITYGGHIPVSGNNIGAVQTGSPRMYSYTSKLKFAGAGPGSPDSIIVKFKGSAPTGRMMKVEPLDQTYVYSDNMGFGYSGFNPDGQ